MIQHQQNPAINFIQKLSLYWLFFFLFTTTTNINNTVYLYHHAPPQTSLSSSFSSLSVLSTPFSLSFDSLPLIFHSSLFPSSFPFFPFSLPSFSPCSLFNFLFKKLIKPLSYPFLCYDYSLHFPTQKENDFRSFRSLLFRK